MRSKERVGRREKQVGSKGRMNGGERGVKQARKGEE